MPHLGNRVEQVCGHLIGLCVSSPPHVLVSSTVDGRRRCLCSRYYNHCRVLHNLMCRPPLTSSENRTEQVMDAELQCGHHRSFVCHCGQSFCDLLVWNCHRNCRAISWSCPWPFA